MGLGCLPLLMIYHLAGGGWGFTIRRIIESGTRTLPLMALLFVPILFGIHDLYEWSNEEIVEGSETLQQKSMYLNTPFWLIRALVYFSIWSFYAYRLTNLSTDQDRTGDTAIEQRFERISAPGLVVYAFTVTFASFDWAMSLEPLWYSTIYGLLWIVGQTLAALAFSVVMVALLSRRPPLDRLARAGNIHDLGNLLLAFVILWAYLSFCQFLIIWSANLPEEIHWYLSRLDNGWQWLAITLLLFHFAAPLMLLLSRRRKERVRSLAVIAGLILVMRMLDTYWIVMPAFYNTAMAVHWLDVVALVGIGGVWLAAYAAALATAPLAPLHDPNMAPHKAI
jgi:hypothetical protein